MWYVRLIITPDAPTDARDETGRGQGKQGESGFVTRGGESKAVFGGKAPGLRFVKAEGGSEAGGSLATKTQTLDDLLARQKEVLPHPLSHPPAPPPPPSLSPSLPPSPVLLALSCFPHLQ